MAGSSRPNVVLISLDSVRADRTVCWPGAPAGDLTPAMGRLAEQAVVFERCIAHSSWTLPNHATMFTGAYPCDHGLVQAGAEMTAGVVPLAAHLGDLGYGTASFSMVPFFIPKADVTTGFQHVRYPEWRRSGRRVRGVSAAAVKWACRQGDTPFFLFLHQWGAHWPYVASPGEADAVAEPPASPAAPLWSPTPLHIRLLQYYWHRLERVPVLGGLPRWFRRYRRARKARKGIERAPVGKLRNLIADINQGRRELTDEEVAFLRMRYDRRVAWADGLLGETVDLLRSGVDLDRTLLIVLSDHGDSLYEHGDFGHMDGLRNPVIHPLMMMRLPGGERGGGRVEGIAGQIDVAPTVLDCLGAAPRGLVRGRSLLDAAAGRALPERPMFAELTMPWVRQEALIHEGYKLFCDRLDGTERLYRYPEDYLEQDDLAAAEPERLQRLRRALADIRSGQDTGLLEAAAAPPMDPQVRRRLEELGYL